MDEEHLTLTLRTHIEQCDGRYATNGYLRRERHGPGQKKFNSRLVAQLFSEARPSARTSKGFLVVRTRVAVRRSGLNVQICDTVYWTEWIPGTLYLDSGDTIPGTLYLSLPWDSGEHSTYLCRGFRGHSTYLCRGLESSEFWDFTPISQLCLPDLPWVGKIAILSGVRITQRLPEELAARCRSSSSRPAGLWRW